MITEKMSAYEFNYLLKNAGHDEELMKKFFNYCSAVIREYINFNFGDKSFYSEVPSDIITTIIYDKRPTKYIVKPVAFLCRVTHNYIIDLLKLKGNQTLELFENCPYEYNFETNLEFSDKEVEKIWYKLDYKSRSVMYLSAINGYALKEVAEILNLNYDNVRTIKSRAQRFLKENIKKLEKEEVNK